TAGWLAAQYPQVRVHRLQHNHGFAAANNVGFQLARAPLIATLNNDAIPAPDWLAQLVAAAHAHPEAGMFASRMVYLHDPDTIDAAGILTDAAGIAWNRRAGERATPEPDREVFGACAGAALYRKAMLAQLGGFDPTFFAYLEDVDLAWRAQWAGWRAWYVDGARARHAHSSTAVEESPFKTFHLGRNKVWTIVKNYPWPALVRYGPLILAYDLASLPFTVLRQRSLAALQGRLAALRELPRVARARRAARAQRRVRWDDIRTRLAPIAPPWGVWARQRALRATLKRRPAA
ncbi:MAG: glycosyltransferase family 2 protein, partial [Actinobacteria bacterium]|nr:glycosyltransferase family 2 protein [Actinomycetota bacterium]